MAKRGFNISSLLRVEYIVGGIIVIGVGWYLYSQQQNKEKEEDDELLKEIDDITKPKIPVPPGTNPAGVVGGGEPPGTGQGAITPPSTMPPFSQSPTPYQYQFPYVPPGFNPNPYPTQRPIVTQPPPVGGDIPPSTCTCPDGKFYDHCNCRCVPEGSIVTMCYRNCGCPGDQEPTNQTSLARAFYSEVYQVHLS